MRSTNGAGHAAMTRQRGATRGQLAASGCLYLRPDWRDVDISRTELQRLAAVPGPELAAD